MSSHSNARAQPGILVSGRPKPPATATGSTERHPTGSSLPPRCPGGTRRALGGTCRRDQSCAPLAEVPPPPSLGEWAATSPSQSPASSVQPSGLRAFPGHSEAPTATAASQSQVCGPGPPTPLGKNKTTCRPISPEGALGRAPGSPTPPESRTVRAQGEGTEGPARHQKAACFVRFSMSGGRTENLPLQQ